MPDKTIADVLLYEFDHKIKNGLYGLTQTALTYNSNHLEGSTLTEEQTAFLFDTGTIGGDGAFYRTKDVEEAQGHFLMFNRMLQTLDQDLSQDLIKSFHYALKAGVFEDRANGYAIGEYKTRPNRVGIISTALPEDVPGKMHELLEEYHKIGRHGYDELIRFHVQYEAIHPFQDGNGRTGRLILFRECLKNNLPPIIVRDKNNLAYKQALGKAQTTGDYVPLMCVMRSEINWYAEIAEPYLRTYEKEDIQKKEIGINPGE